MPTITATNDNFVVAQSDRFGGYIPHVFRNRAQFVAWMAETHCKDILPPTLVHGRCKPAVDHRRETYIDVDQDEHEHWLEHLETEYNFEQEALAMTTTPVTPKPATPQPQPQPPSPAHLEVQALRAEVKDLRAMLAETLAAISDKLIVHDAKLNAIAISIAASQAVAAAPAPAMPDAHGNGSVVFHCDTIVMSIGDDGKPAYKAKGGRFAKFGVRVWPETLAVLGLKADALKPGPNTFDRDVRAELAESVDKETGEKTMIARKVIGLA